MDTEHEAPELAPGEMLQSEFAYIAQTAFQANEDRARVTTFYLVNLGGLVAALVSSQLSNSLQPEVNLLLACLFLILSFSGLLTILQLVRLRDAWHESVRAMNRIKAYYASRFSQINLSEAFGWNATTLPARYKASSISFLLAIQVALLSAISLAAAVYYIGLLAGVQAWLGALLGGLAFFIIQLVLYWNLLREKKKKK